jgi:Type IV secretory system Conjugative DNA transfer
MLSIKIKFALSIISTAMIGGAVYKPSSSAFLLAKDFQIKGWGRVLEHRATYGNLMDQFLLKRLRPFNQPWRVGAGVALSTQYGKTWNQFYAAREPSPRPMVYMVIGLVGFAGLMVALKKPSKKPSTHYGAQWSSKKELDNFLRRLGHRKLDNGLMLASWPNSTLFLATFPGQLKRLETMHVAVIAATRSGKTLMLVTNLVRWRGSAVVIDPKSELRNMTATVRQSLGQRIVTLDPRGFGDTIDIIASVGDNEDGIAGLVELLLDVKRQSNPAFALRAVPGGIAAIQAARAIGCSPWKFIRDQIHDPQAFAQAIYDSGDARARFNLALFLAGDWGVKANRERILSDRFFTSSWGTFTSELRTVLTDGVCAMFGGSSFKPEDLLNQKLTAYLMFDDKAGSNKALSMLLYAINRRIKSLADGNPKAKNQGRVLFVLEELGSVPMPGLPEEITTASGRGVTFLYVIHDLPQLEGLYGARGAKTILNNTGAKVFYGTSDPTTAQYVESVMGYTSVSDVRISKGAQGKQAGDSESIGHYKRELMPAHEMYSLKPDEVVVEYRPHRVRAQRVNWLAIPELKKLSVVPPLEPAARIVDVRAEVQLDSSQNPNIDDTDEVAGEVKKTYFGLDE